MITCFDKGVQTAGHDDSSLGPTTPRQWARSSKTMPSCWRQAERAYSVHAHQRAIKKQFRLVNG